MKGYRVFVGHAFEVEDTDDLRDALKRAFRNTNFELWYADLEVRRDGHIITKIEGEIRSSRIAIFEVSTGNPNVCMELGYARGTNKSLYIIYKSGTKIPSNLRGLDAIEYSNYSNLIRELRKKVIRPEVERIESQDRLVKFLGPLPVVEENVFRCAIEIYQAEELEHKFGEEVEDSVANNQRAWVADLSKDSSHFIFGPYDPLEELGEYVAIFKMKIDDISYKKIDDISYKRPLFLLDVYGGAKGKFRVRGSHFTAPNQYQFFGIPFRYTSGDDLEYRAAKRMNIKVRVWTDYVAIVRISAMQAMDQRDNVQ